MPLAMGSYLLVIQGEDAPAVNCPVMVARQEEETLEIPLYTADEIGAGMVYVPPGWCILGSGSGLARPPQTRFVPGFFIGRTEVTCGQYLEFLEGLKATNPELAHKREPRVSPTDTVASVKVLACNRHVEWPFTPLDLPVFCITWRDAEAYCRWLSERTGRAFRLPTSVEWEKAARGVDGREFPWGGRKNRRYANTYYAGKDPTEYGIAPCASHPLDVSPYGLYDVAGNLSEMCLDMLTRSNRTCMAGRWRLHYLNARLAMRFHYHPEERREGIGFRVVCDVPRR